MSSITNIKKSERNSPSLERQLNSTNHGRVSNHLRRGDQNEIYDTQHSFRNPNIIMKQKSRNSPKSNYENEDADMKRQLGKLSNFFLESSDKGNFQQFSPPQTRSQSTQREELSSPKGYQTSKLSRDTFVQSFQSEVDVVSNTRKITLPKVLTAFHTNQIKHMIKPDKGLCLSVKALLALFVGCEDWFPSDDNFYKRNLSWTELQNYICHPEFHSVLAQATKLISSGKIPIKNYQSSLLVLQMCNQISSQFKSIFSQIQSAIMVCTQDLLTFYEQDQGLEDYDEIISPRSTELQKHNFNNPTNKPDEISVTFDAALVINTQKHQSINNQLKGQSLDYNSNGVFFEQDKLSPIQKNDDYVKQTQTQQDYNNDISFDSMLNISDKRLVKFNKKQVSIDTIQYRKNDSNNNGEKRQSVLSGNSHNSQQQTDKNIISQSSRKKSIKNTSINEKKIVNRNDVRDRCTSEMSQKPRFSINTSSSQMKVSPKSTCKSYVSQQITSTQSQSYQSQQNKFSSCKLKTDGDQDHKQKNFNSNEKVQQKQSSKRHSLFQAKALETDQDKIVKQHIISEKKGLHQIIQQHKKIINKLQDQESQIKWRIEREAKQLLKLEQDHKIKKEMTWNRQQKFKQEDLLRQEHDNQKKERQINYQFRQQLRENPSSVEKNVIQDSSYNTLQYIARKSQDNLRLCEERLYTVQNSIKPDQRSVSNIDKQHPTYITNYF